MKTVNVDYSQFKSLLSSKALLGQYKELSDRYELFAIEGVYVSWETTILKDSDEGTDFEVNHKANYNKPLEIKAGPGRPPRMAPSPQPINTIQKFKGFMLTIPANETTATLDVQWASKDIYLKGGIIKAGVDMVSPTDTMKMDVLYAANDMLIVPNILESIPLHNGGSLSFSSPESMYLAKELKLRITVSCSSALVDRHIHIIAEYFE